MVRRFATKTQRILLFIFQDGRCAMCEQPLLDMEADHIVRFTDGGETCLHNLQLVCPDCHFRKTYGRDREPSAI